MSELLQIMFLTAIGVGARIMCDDIWREIKRTRAQWLEDRQKQIPAETIDLEAEFEQQWLKEFWYGCPTVEQLTGREKGNG